MLTQLAKYQAHMTTWRRFVLGVFVFAWLNVAAQPCAMAMGLSPGKQINTEFSGSADHGQHTNHHVGGSDTADCGHCPPGGGDHSKHCSTSAVASCEDVPIPNSESRHTKLKLEDLSHIPLLSAMPVRQLLVPAAGPLRFVAVDRLKHTSEPPLNIRYCVYLI